MGTFKIEIQEFLSRIVEVEANSIDEAISKVREMYKNEEIVLDSEDYTTTEIEEYKDEMNDPRIILRDRLIENGISIKDANLIALDAGSSQAYVDIEYLKDFDLSENLFKIALKLVSEFYSGKLFE